MRISRRHLLRGAGAVAMAAAAPKPLAARSATGPTDVRPDGFCTSATLGARAAGGANRTPPLRLARNESAYGPSPAAVAAVARAETAAASRYPDVECHALQRKLADRYGVGPERITLAAGSANLLRAAAHAFLGPGSSIVVAQPTCEVITESAALVRATIIRVPLTPDWSHDLTVMRRRVTEATRLVYLCNPHNPTGSLTRRSEIERFIRDLPVTTHILLDEAYHEYVRPAADYASFLDRPVDDRRVIVSRTFSKAYGLAGLRIGYALVDPDVAARLDCGTTLSNVTTVAALAASAALDDRTHVATVVRRVIDDRQEFYNQANARMLRVIDSHANFVMLNTARRARDIVDHFARNGVALPPPAPPLDEYIRVSLGTAADMSEFWRVWDLMSQAHTL